MLDSLLSAASDRYGSTPQAIRSRLRFAPHVDARIWTWLQLYAAGWPVGRIADEFERCESSVRQTIDEHQNDPRFR